MLQPFPAVKSPCKNNSTKCPVCKHTDPDTHRSESHNSDQKYTETESTRPHRTAGNDHGKFHISRCTKSISRYECHDPDKRLYNCDPHHHMKTHICTFFSIPPRIVIGFVSANTPRQLMMIITSAITQSFFM